MKIAQISDTHIGITTEGQLKVMFRALAKEEFDIIVHCGDYGGTTNGAKCVKRTVEMMRKFFPDKPIVSTIGNHDYWCYTDKRHGASVDSFDDNLASIEWTFEQHKVHYIDVDGVYRHPDFKDIVLIGSSGWYQSPNPPTNDGNWMPIGIEGDTHRYILKKTEDNLFRSVDQLDAIIADKEDFVSTVVFVSHFPVVDTGNDYKGAFERFSWRSSLSSYFIEKYNCKHFLCGHAHQLHNGPLRYECGPDYNKPTYQIIEVY